MKTTTFCGHKLLTKLETGENRYLQEVWLHSKCLITENAVIEEVKSSVEVVQDKGFGVAVKMPRVGGNYYQAASDNISLIIT